MTDAQFDEFMAVYMAYWPEAPILGPGAMVIWRQKLDQVDERAVVAALETLFHDGSHFAPALGELVRRTHDLADDTPPWEVAWAEVRNAAVEHGHAADWRALSWSHPVIREAVALIGWQGVCNSEVGDTTFAAQARRAFDGARLRAQQGQRYASITGLDLPARRARDGFEPTSPNVLSLFGPPKGRKAAA